MSPSNFWWAGRKFVNTPPAPTPQLVLDGLYGSWRFEEGSGTAANSEAGKTSVLTLTSDNTSTQPIPTWRSGGGVVFPGPTSSLKRVWEAAQDATTGVTITMALKVGAFTGVKSIMQRSSGNLGFTLQANKSAGKLQISMGLGSSRSTASIFSYTDNSIYVFSISIPNTGEAAALNLNGTNPSFTPNTFAWQGAGNAASLLLGYTFVGEIYYAAYHNKPLDAVQKSDMVAYAKSIATARGIAT